MTTEKRIRELKRKQQQAFDKGNFTVAGYYYDRIKELRYDLVKQ